MFELIVNILLLVFFGYTLAFHVLEAPIPEKVARNPYYLQPNVWPTVILWLLIICLIANIIKIILKNKGKESFTLASFMASIPTFLKTRMFRGIVLVLAASFMLEPLGFMVTTLFILLSYGYLLGGASLKWKLPVIAVGITIFLYIAFSIWLQVNLPRGTVPAMRNFALWIESLL